MGRKIRASGNNRVAAASLAALIIFLASCFGTGDNLPNRTGVLTGVLYDQSSGNPLAGVKVTMDNRGRVYNAVTEADGSFSLETGLVIRGEGYNVHFSRENFQTAARAAVFELPNLRVDLGRVDLYDSGPVEMRNIRGRVLDNLSDDGLADASVRVQVTYQSVPGGTPVTETYVALTDSQGNFQISGKGFMLHSSYALTVTKNNYITRSDVTVQITGSVNDMDGGSVHLILNFGDIAGRIMDDDGAVPLEGAGVTANDGLGNAVPGTTGADGRFTLKSEHFYLGRSYTVSFSRTDYFPATSGIFIGSTGENVIDGDPLSLKINGYVTGIVRNASGQAVPGAAISSVDSAGTTVSVSSSAGGAFILASPGFRKGHQYSLEISHTQFYGKSIITPTMVQGENGVGVVYLHGIPTGGGYRLTGTVADWWDKTVKLGATIKVKDRQGNDLQATADPVTGAFQIEGDFTIGDTCGLGVSFPGYSGESAVAGETLPVIITGSSPQSAGTIHLYPLGVRAKIGGVARKFSSAIRQTHEKFLTNRFGFTLSARDGANIETSSAFYLHADDLADQYAGPWGVRSVPTAVNGARVRGIVINGRNDGRMNAYTFGMPGSSHYHFYVNAPGDFAIETYGGTDTVFYLYNAAGSSLASDDNGGTSGCSKITRYLPAGWYNLKVAGSASSTFGRFELDVKGPGQNAGATGTWNVNDLILSWYSHEYKTVYIAGAGEAGSAGSLTVTKMDRRGGLARGSFTGSLRAINSFGAVISVTDGYFNVERSE